TPTTTPCVRDNPLRLTSRYVAHRAEPCISRLRRPPPVSTRRTIPMRKPPPIVPHSIWGCCCPHVPTATSASNRVIAEASYHARRNARVDGQLRAPVHLSR